jgi:hypothetical protein
VQRFSIALACAAVMVGAATACNPTSLKPGFCHSDKDCPSGKICTAKLRCDTPNDASADSPEVEVGDAADAVDGRDARDAEIMLRCPLSISCADGGYDGGAGVCDEDAGRCVECKDDSHCTRDRNAPICETQVCRPCKTDAECPDPKICMTDGHCAPSDEVMYVEFKSTGTGCGTADGSSANPFCTANEAVSRLASGRDVIVIRGPVNGPMAFTMGVPAVVLGRPNTLSEAGQIATGVGAGIVVSTGVVVLRDLEVRNGGSVGSRGIVASGSSTQLTLSNVRVNLGMGLGIQADTAATLTMRGCTVENNAGSTSGGVGGGGMLLDGASFDIQNTSVTNNGPGMDLMGNVWGGIRISNPVAGSKMNLVTVKDNKQVGISCSGMVSGTGVLATNNVGGVEITNAACGFSSCGTVVTTTCGSQL